MHFRNNANYDTVKNIYKRKTKKKEKKNMKSDCLIAEKLFTKLTFELS